MINKDFYKGVHMKYRFLTKKEEERAIIQILEKLLDTSVPYSGSHRRAQWEKGWAENLESGNGVPKYFGKYKVNRLNGRLVIGESENYEREMLYSIVDSLAKKYLMTARVFEYGCGTGHNLWRVKALNPKAKLVGFDWTRSSNKLVSAQGFEGVNFDFFNPPKLRKMKSVQDDLAIYTVAALEQTGTNFKAFVNYVLKLRPSVVVHIEPIPELLDSTKLLDYLSIQYMFKRHYLRGYLTYLESLEKKEKIKILEARRSGIGSLMIDGYSVVVWKPL